MRILVVDDSAFMRRAISRMIESEPDLQVIDTAVNGEEAVEKARRLRPDVITLDIEMPVMNGLEALRQIMDNRPVPVLMCSSLTKEGSREALEALALGAADFVTKDASHVSVKIDNIRDDLITKIRAIAKGGHTPVPVKLVEAPPPTPKKNLGISPGKYDILLIGSSTGGPPILEQILSRLPADLSVPVVVAQHMPALFTQTMADRLNGQCVINVVHETGKVPLYPGTVYIAIGGKHAHIKKSIGGRLSMEMRDDPKDALYKPSVNVLFATGARACGEKCLGVVLTGMGEDGLEGGKQLCAKGGLLLAQDQRSSVVYGMPKAVTEAGLTAASMPPEGLASHLARLSPSFSEHGESMTSMKRAG